MADMDVSTDVAQASTLDALSSDASPSSSSGEAVGAPRRWSSLGPRHLGGVAVACVATPFVVVLLRYAIAQGHVFVSDDLALIDVCVRDALVWKQAVGPWDHYGWHHPGPAFFYLLSLSARVFGPGAKADIMGATFINALCAVATVWLVRRRSGSAAALWSASCLAILALVVDRAPHFYFFGSDALEAATSPWNPAVVIFPLVFLGVLCACGALGSTLSVLGAVLVSSFVIQSDVSAAPLVLVFLALAVIAWVRQTVVASAPRARARGDSRFTTAGDPSGRGHNRPRLLAGLVMAAFVVAVWIPPIIEEITGTPGNLTKIWRFFTAHHPAHGVMSSLQAVASVYGIFTSSGAHLHAPLNAAVGLTLLVVLLIGAAAIAFGVQRRRHLAVGLGATSLIGFIVAVVSGTRVVGPIRGYILVWAVCLPVLALMGIGIGLVGGRDGDSSGVAVKGGEAGRTRLTLTGLAVALSLLFSAQMLSAPSLANVSDPAVATAWQAVAHRLGPPGTRVFVNALTNPAGWATMMGLVDEIRAHGYQPRVDPTFAGWVGQSYLASGNEGVQVVLYRPLPEVVKWPGYVAHTPNADVVITYSKAKG